MDFALAHNVFLTFCHSTPAKDDVFGVRINGYIFYASFYPHTHKHTDKYREAETTFSI